MAVTEPSRQEWTYQPIDHMIRRVLATCEGTAEGFPHYADGETGIWTVTDHGDWTGGFAVGLAWLALRAGAASSLEPRIAVWLDRLSARRSSHTVFRGFLFWYGAGLGAVWANSGRAQQVALEGAVHVVEDFDPRLGLVPLGTEAEEADSVGCLDTNIDGVPGTVALLGWASRVLGSSEMLEIARMHTLRHIELCQRPDGSFCQSVRMDESGTSVRRYTHKGMSADSTWGRAQAWGMLGLAQACHWVSDEFVPAAVSACEWWIANAPSDRASPWDFGDADGPRDTSATAIAASALLKLAGVVPGEEGVRYRAYAERAVRTLVEYHLTPVATNDTRPVGMLVAGAYSPRLNLAVNSELVWGDYFLLEDLSVLAGHIEAGET